MAPEVLNNHDYKDKVDMWAIGIIMHYVITGKHPFYQKGDDLEELKEKLRKLKYLQDDKCFSKLASMLFHRLCAVKVKCRYTASKALEHPWITRK